MKAAIIIPARYASSRFPGKPLASIAGRSLIERVWRIASAVRPESHVLIATDDSRIEAHAKAFGASVVITDEKCRNGSERVHEALNKSKLAVDIVVNLQGDTPLTPPWVIESLIKLMIARPEVQLSTPAVRLSLKEHAAAVAKIGKSVSGTYVVTSQDGAALYFTRFPVPFIRSDSKLDSSKPLPFFKHLGIYAYRPKVLERYIGLSPTPLEELEQLEQLRALEHGIPIHVAEVDLKGRSIVSVDTPEDAKEAERIIGVEGDIVAA